jgi:hypothetical protein
VPERDPAFGAAVTVTVLVAVASEHPLEVTVYVIVAVPAETPVTTPDELTVAMLASLDVHAPPLEPLEVNVVVPATHIACVPDKVPAEGHGL